MTGIAAAMIAVTALVPRLDAVVGGYALQWGCLAGAALPMQCGHPDCRSRLGPGPGPGRLYAGFCRCFEWRQHGLGRRRLPPVHPDGPALCRRRPGRLGLLAALRYRIILDEELDLTPSLHWPEPHLILEPKPDQGPVLVTVEYLIDSRDSAILPRPCEPWASFGGATAPSGGVCSRMSPTRPAFWKPLLWKPGWNTGGNTKG